MSFGATAQLPDLGSSASRQLSDEQLDTFRSAFIRSLYDSHLVNTDPDLNQWLTALGRHLAQHAALPRPPVFLLINDPSINAFAGPGGIIGIHTGLILAAERTDEVAAVLAHELAHVQQRHLLRRIDQGRNSDLSTLASILAALLIGRQDIQAGFAAFYASQGLSAQQQLAFSRAHETEADGLGIRILAEAGYDPLAMASFFDKLYQQSRTDSIHIPEILRTHPVSSHRLADALDRAEALKPISTVATPPELLPFVQARLDSSASATDACVRCYRRLLKHRSSCSDSCHNANWLVALQQARQADDPFKALSRLMRARPANAAVRLAMAEHAPDPNTALDALRDWQNFPPPLRTMMLEKLAAIEQHRGRPDAGRLYAALAAYEKGYTHMAQALLDEIDGHTLKPAERLLRQALEAKGKKTGQSRMHKQNFISSLNIAMTPPAKTLAFAGGLSNLMLQEQRLAQKLSS